MTTYPKRLIETAAGEAQQQAGGTIMSRDEAQRLVQRVIARSRAEQIQVNVNSSTQTNVRFADNRISTAGSVQNNALAIQSSFGPKSAVVSTNDMSDEGLERAVRQSEALARLAPDNPEAMPALPAQQYSTPRSFFTSVSELSAAARAEAARVAIDLAKAGNDLKAAGFIQADASANALGNNKGLFAYHPETSVNYTLTVRTTDGTGSGWAGVDERDWSDVDFRSVAQRAIQKARLSQNPVAIEPGRYTVILEPQAVADLVSLLAFSLDARSADEGRSAFSKQGGGTKIGDRIVDERVTIISDPTDPDLLTQPFDGEGLPLGRQVWVENGVLKNLFHSRFWAQKQNKPVTGFPTSVKMLGGNATLDEMIASTPRGVLVTRLWYLRQVDPRTILYTGLTRDGTFLVENGKISKSIRNFRFNESPLFMLNNVEMLGRPVRIAGAEGGGSMAMPALKVRDFNFTSLSEAV